ncbi:hypothetical protein L195_g054494, partial [Trifolium pratense]
MTAEDIIVPSPLLSVEHNIVGGVDMDVLLQTTVSVLPQVVCHIVQVSDPLLVAEDTIVLVISQVVEPLVRKNKTV